MISNLVVVCLFLNKSPLSPSPPTFISLLMPLASLLFPLHFAFHNTTHHSFLSDFRLTPPSFLFLPAPFQRQSNLHDVMDSKIPAYTYPCLASSFYSNNPQLIFLFGVPDGTPTLVSHLIDISNIDAPKISYISSNSKADRQYKWDSKAEKSCFTNTMSFISGGFANTEVQQLGTTTFAAILYASFELQHMFDMSMVKFKTSKLFASTRVHGRDDYVVAWAVFTFADPVSGAPTVKEGWVGVFRNTSNIFVTYVHLFSFFFI